MKQIEQAFDSVASGCVTSLSVAERLGVPRLTAAARLRDLEALGLIERAGFVRLNEDGEGRQRSGRCSTEWRLSESVSLFLHENT